MMSVTKACEILGVAVGCSEKEYNDAFREKSKKLHPDKNKEENTEVEYKKVTEAHAFLKEHGTTVKKEPFAGGFWTGTGGGGTGYASASGGGAGGARTGAAGHAGRAYRGGVADDGRGRGGFTNIYDQFINDFMHDTKSSEVVPLEISFEESILGCEKKYSFVRKTECSKCDGASLIGKRCSTCEGKGVIYQKQGMMVFGINCSACKGVGRIKEDPPPNCDHCLNRGFEDKETELKIKIPAGIIHGNHIRCPEGGNFNGFYNKYDDLTFNIVVQKSDKFERVNNSVVSRISISLLEALKGCSKSVQTVKGEKTLKIKKGVRNNDILRISNFGVPPVGCHEFIVTVEYPENTDKLVEFLEQGEAPVIELKEN